MTAAAVVPGARGHQTARLMNTIIDICCILRYNNNQNTSYTNDNVTGNEYDGKREEQIYQKKA